MNKRSKMLKSLVGVESKNVSPSFFMQWLNGSLSHVEGGHITVEFEVRKDMCNPSLILHGGVIAGMMDEVAGIALYSLDKKFFYTTLNLNVDYLRSAKLGDKVQVTAEVVRSGSRIVNIHVSMKNDKVLLAQGSTNLIVTDKQVPQNMSLT